MQNMANRTGLRICARNIDIEIRDAFKKFAKWLRLHYEFPLRLPIYISNNKHVIGRDGEAYLSIFFAPFDGKIEPFVKIAVGDYQALIEERGKENAIFELLFSLAIGFVEYQKWLEDNSKLDSCDSDC